MICRRWVLQSVAGLACLGTIAGCSDPYKGGNKGEGISAEVRPLTPEELGAPLYKATPPAELPTFSRIEDQIVVPNAIVRLDKKQTVPAQIDGYLEVIATTIPPGTPYDPNDKDIVMYQVDLSKPEKIPLRRVREGDRVSAGQLVAIFNELEIAVQIESSQRIIKTSEEAIAAAKEGEGYIEEQLNKMREIKGAVSEQEILNAQATLARYKENRLQSEREKVRAEGEEKRGWALASKHKAHSMVNGIVTKVIRSPGEYLKAGEPIMEILATDEQQVEGNLDVKDASFVFPGMKVTVEPATPVGPDIKMGAIDHRLEVTGVAITAHPGRPQVVSASLDGTAVVWDVFPASEKTRVQTRLQHPAGVRSVATTPPNPNGQTTKHLIVTGADDGKVRFWDATNLDKLNGKEPSHTGDSTHASSVTRVNFSPDGRFVASAAGRDVWVWDAATGKRLYTLPGEHKDAVTDVHFTPQATLVTVARDRTVRIWGLHANGARLDRTIDHRKANVDVLGLTRDGGRMLFDQEDGRIDVINLMDGHPVGSIQNAAASARFSTLAIFSSDDSLVLTANAGGDGQGELQIWKAPMPGGRGSEWRRLVTPGRATPTCAAVSHEADKRFVVVGTAAGRVHLWSREANEQMAKAVKSGVVTSVLRLDPRTVKIRVETETQPGEAVDLLQDKASATIIIRAGQTQEQPKAPAAPALPAVPEKNAAAPAPETGIVQAGALVPMETPKLTSPAPVVVPSITAPTVPMDVPQIAPQSGTGTTITPKAPTPGSGK